MNNAASDDTNRFAPPTAHVEDISTGSQELGGRGARLGASLIDTLIQLAVYYALAFTVFSALIPTNTLSRGVGAFALQMIVSFVLFAALQSYLLATQGQTIGKKLMGLRIVRSNGERATLGRLLGLRYFLGWVIAVIPIVGVIYALVDCLLIFRESHKCLHDNIADTLVIKA
jgi:uncharacterized RDD family membrane protein YckC